MSYHALSRTLLIIQCYCGNTLDSSRATTSGCTSTCAGDSQSSCGGAYRLNIYQIASAPSTPTSTSARPSTTSIKPSTTSVKPSSSAAPSTSTSSAPAASASVFGVKAPPSSSAKKYVWAHHMVGNVSTLTNCPNPADQ